METVLGSRFLTSGNITPMTIQRGALARIPLVIFMLLFVVLPLVPADLPLIAVFSHFYQAGSLVFGGGHVVLPLLQNALDGQVSNDVFLTGYAAAQAVPGPMFTFATFLGFTLIPEMPVTAALVATLAIFLPGFLLLLGLLKNWQALSAIPEIHGALTGVNAAVVGLLFAALYQPIFTSAVHSSFDAASLLLGFVLMKTLRLPIPVLVAYFSAFGILLSLI